MDNNLVSHEEMMRRQKLGAMEAQSTCAGAEKAYAPSPMGLADCGVSVSHDPLHVLRMQVRDGHRRAQDAARALDILERHPEFHELVWLVRSGLV